MALAAVEKREKMTGELGIYQPPAGKLCGRSGENPRPATQRKPTATNGRLLEVQIHDYVDRAAMVALVRLN